MLVAEMCMSSLSPAADKIIIQHAADQRTGDWNQPARPLLNEFSAGFRRDALNDFRYHPVDEVLLDEITSQIHARGAGGCKPELRGFFVGVVFEAIDQAQLLHGAQSNSGENTEVRNDGDK